MSDDAICTPALRRHPTACGVRVAHHGDGITRLSPSSRRQGAQLFGRRARWRLNLPPGVNRSVAKDSVSKRPADEALGERRRRSATSCCTEVLGECLAPITGLSHDTVARALSRRLNGIPHARPATSASGPHAPDRPRSRPASRRSRSGAERRAPGCGRPGRGRRPSAGGVHHGVHRTRGVVQREMHRPVGDQNLMSVLVCPGDQRTLAHPRSTHPLGSVPGTVPTFGVAESPRERVSEQRARGAPGLRGHRMCPLDPRHRARLPNAAGPPDTQPDTRPDQHLRRVLARPEARANLPETADSTTSISETVSQLWRGLIGKAAEVGRPRVLGAGIQPSPWRVSARSGPADAF
ncbi:hypothetical protein Ae717Ps2_7308c [Pseudonocardia sp. Ae717_Ps2]|nr:hypothetical protein Ae717Ps2_7308c [Pseudonocardia sp. Ae717_Ps2]